ncbi:uncharacterized protein LOC142550494 [Primulina tabacum]|uniref:uncharacterized protein LOC142550494 n=1 Tax=Primulina tabacum TaxID=48773 RepID=UPI003F59BD40
MDKEIIPSTKKKYYDLVMSKSENSGCEIKIPRKVENPGENVENSGGNHVNSGPVNSVVQNIRINSQASGIRIQNIRINSQDSGIRIVNHVNSCPVNSVVQNIQIGGQNSRVSSGGGGFGEAAVNILDGIVAIVYCTTVVYLALKFGQGVDRWKKDGFSIKFEPKIIWVRGKQVFFREKEDVDEEVRVLTEINGENTKDIAKLHAPVPLFICYEILDYDSAVLRIL